MSEPQVYLLDTNLVSYLGSGRSPAARQTYLEVEGSATIAVSTITQAEILFGLERRPEATRLRTTFEKFFAAIVLVSFDSDAASSYGKLRAYIGSIGVSLSLMDLLIGAHAMALKATLVSHDKAFEQLRPLLSVVDWAVDVR